MKIFNPVIVGSTESRETASSPGIPANPHDHANLPVLNRITVDQHGVLLFDGSPIDTVGQEFVNAAILEQFSVVDNKLYFAGAPVDTVGSVFDNDAVLRMFSTDQNGELLFNGQPIKSTGSSLPNAEDLKRLAIDENNQLTVDGVVVSGSGGQAVMLTVTKLGTGVSLLKGLVGSDLQTRSLVAGTNITLDVSSDEVKINASLSGAVTAATTFKLSDGYTNTNTRSDTVASRLSVAELTADANTAILVPMGADTKNSAGTALTVTGTVIPNQILDQSMNGLATKFTGSGSLLIASAANHASIFAGTNSWTVEVDICRPNNIVTDFFTNYNGNNSTTSIICSLIANGSIWVGLHSGSTLSGNTFTVADPITDSRMRHIEIGRLGSTVYCFVDGVSCGTFTYSSSINTATGNLYFGQTYAGLAPLTGYARNLKVSTVCRHTAAYSKAGYYTSLVGTVNTIDMAGKLLSSMFWKQITSMSVSSTETATAYLKWLMLDANGAWKWDATNKVWVTADAANVNTNGMTTAELIAAMVNNQWNYRSDTIGFCVAFVTTDGTTPVLTGVTLNAVQSADKTAGHSIETANQTLAQRTTLRFLGMDVVDDGARTVVSAFTDSSKLTHKGSSLDTVVSDLVANKGLVGGKGVDVSSGLADGTVLAYNQTADKFKPAVPALGANGSGLFKTAPFTIAAGEEATVVHQQVSDGRAVYQADQVVAGAQASTTLRALLDADKSLVGLQESYPTDPNHRLQLATSYASITKGLTGSFPIAACLGISYVVDDYLYVIAGASTNWSSVTTIYRSPITNPTAFVAVGNTPAGFSSSNGCQAYRYKDRLYVFNGAAVYSASLDAPAVWSQVGTLPVAIIQGAAFIVGTRAYVMGGQLGSTYTPISTVYSADMSDLSTWRTETSLPTPLGRMLCYQYGDYLYMLGGETAFDSTYSNKVYRAHKDTPTTWIQIGTLPDTLGSIDEPVVYNGRVFLFGGRRTPSAVTSAVYSADAGNPVTWTSHTPLTTARQFAIKALVEDVIIIIGGFNGTTWLSSTEVYSLTKTVANGLQGDCTLAQINTSLMQKIVRFEVDAYVPTNTSLYAAVAFDGVWNYFDATAQSWVPCASQADALAASKSVVLNTGNLWYVQGLENYVLGTVKSVQVALRAKNSAANVTPVLRKFALTYLGIDSYEVLLIGRSAYADLSVRHAQGTYTKTLVKNKTSQALTLVLKVCDGASG